MPGAFAANANKRRAEAVPSVETPTKKRRGASGAAGTAAPAEHRTPKKRTTAQEKSTPSPAPKSTPTRRILRATRSKSVKDHDETAAAILQKPAGGYLEERRTVPLHLRKTASMRARELEKAPPPSPPAHPRAAPRRSVALPTRSTPAKGKVNTCPPSPPARAPPSRLSEPQAPTGTVRSLSAALLDDEPQSPVDLSASLQRPSSFQASLNASISRLQAAREARKRQKQQPEAEAPAPPSPPKDNEPPESDSEDERPLDLQARREMMKRRKSLGPRADDLIKQEATFEELLEVTRRPRFSVARLSESAAPDS